MLGLRFLEFLVGDFPVVVLVEEAEDLSEVFGLFLEELSGDMEFSPFDFVVVIEIEGFKEFLLNFFTVEVLQVVGVGGSFNVSNAFLDHVEDCIDSSVPILGVRNSESSLRSARRPYSRNSLASFFPLYSGQMLNSFISLAVTIPSSSLSMILRKDLVKFSSP